jgi:proteic killer suppression protein
MEPVKHGLTERKAALYTAGHHFSGQCMIKSFRHRGIERFFRSGSKAGIQAKHEARLRLQLGRLDAALSPIDMGLPGWNLHPLKGPLKGYWAVSVDGNWRLTFKFEGEDAILVDYQDYH